jgi:hypothetical protein
VFGFGASALSGLVSISGVSSITFGHGSSMLSGSAAGSIDGVCSLAFGEGAAAVSGLGALSGTCPLAFTCVVDNAVASTGGGGQWQPARWTFYPPQTALAVDIQGEGTVAYAVSGRGSLDIGRGAEIIGIGRAAEAGIYGGDLDTGFAIDIHGHADPSGELVTARGHLEIEADIIGQTQRSATLYTLPVRAARARRIVDDQDLREFALLVSGFQ